jgi:F-type H+-transporting ATPase subunit epsilon
LAKSSFRCKLITPDAVVLDNQAVQAVLPAWDGMLGVLPNRSALVTQLGTGELRISFADEGAAKGGTRSFFIDDGFAQMLDNELTILAAAAVGAEKLSEADAQAEVASLNARRTDNLSGSELDQLTKLRKRAEAKLRAAREFKAKGAY